MRPLSWRSALASPSFDTAYRPSPICPLCGHPGPTDQQQFIQELSCPRCRAIYQSRRNVVVDFTTYQPGANYAPPPRRCLNCASTLQTLKWMVDDVTRKPPETLPGLVFKYHGLLVKELEGFSDPSRQN